MIKSSRAPTDADDETVSTRQLMLVLLPAGAVIIGAGLWLWSRNGHLVWFDSAAAFLAGCFG